MPLRIKLGLQFYARSPAAIPFGIASLNDEIWLHTMKGQPIIEFFLDQFHHPGYRLGRDIRKELNTYFSKIHLDCDSMLELLHRKRLPRRRESKEGGEDERPQHPFHKVNPIELHCHFSRPFRGGFQLQIGRALIKICARRGPSIFLTEAF